MYYDLWHIFHPTRRLNRSFPLVTNEIRIRPLLPWYGLCQYQIVYFCHPQQDCEQYWWQLILTIELHFFLSLQLVVHWANINTPIPYVNTLNWASVMDLATKDCFLLLQVTRFHPINVQYPDVDLISCTNISNWHPIRSSWRCSYFKKRSILWVFIQMW